MEVKFSFVVFGGFVFSFVCSRVEEKKAKNSPFTPRSCPVAQGRGKEYVIGFGTHLSEGRQWFLASLISVWVRGMRMKQVPKCVCLCWKQHSGCYMTEPLTCAWGAVRNTEEISWKCWFFQSSCMLWTHEYPLLGKTLCAWLPVTPVFHVWKTHRVFRLGFAGTPPWCEKEKIYRMCKMTRIFGI